MITKHGKVIVEEGNITAMDFEFTGDANTREHRLTALEWAMNVLRERYESIQKDGSIL